MFDRLGVSYRRRSRHRCRAMRWRAWFCRWLRRRGRLRARRGGNRLRAQCGWRFSRGQLQLTLLRLQHGAQHQGGGLRLGRILLFTAGMHGERAGNGIYNAGGEV